MALVALLMAGTADAQVSVRRQSRSKSEGEAAGTAATTPANRPKPGKPATPPARTGGEGSASTPARRVAETVTGAANANNGTTVRTSPKTAKKVSGTNSDAKAAAQHNGKTLRQNAFDDYQKESQEETPWQHVVYREIDLTIEQNASLYYPIEPQEGLTNLFRVIIDAFARGELKAYEYLGDRESFTDKYVAKPQDVLDKHEIPYRIEQPKGKSVEEYVIDDVDVPSHEVLSYLVKERWEFDQKHSRFVPRILCLCPVLHRAGETGGDHDKSKYPLFWVNFEDLRPLLRDHLVVSPGMNHAARYSMEEFFTLYRYEGTIYKEQNLRGLTLAQQYPNPDSLKIRQKEIDDQLRSFGKQIWVEEESSPALTAKKESKSEEKSEASPAAPADSRLVKTGRRDRRTKQEVVVDSAAVETKATQRRSVRR